MKKIFALLVLVVLLSACGRKDDVSIIPESGVETIDNSLVSTPESEDSVEPTDPPEREDDNTLYNGVCKGEDVPEMRTDIDFNLTPDELQKISDEFRMYQLYTDGQVFSGHFNEVLDTIPTVMSKQEYEVLEVHEATPDYPFRILVLRFDNYYTYVVSESLSDGMVFISVPNGDVNYMDYAYKIGTTK